ncbi:protein ORF54 [Cyprinid herpesvirus 2]|nr:protein ORF54 [Cyprinid herpesvirus 2]
MPTWPMFRDVVEKPSTATTSDDDDDERAPKKLKLPVNTLLTDYIQRLEDCPRGAHPTTMRLYHHVAQSIAELQQLLVDVCRAGGGGQAVTYAINKDNIPMVKHIIKSIVFAKNPEEKEYEEMMWRARDPPPPLPSVEVVERRETQALAEMEPEFAECFKNMGLDLERAEKAFRICGNIYRAMLELKRRDFKNGDITREAGNAISALEVLSDKLLKNVPAVRDELASNPVTQTKGATYVQNLENTFKHYNLPFMTQVQHIKPYPEGHYMLHGEQLLINTPRPVTAPTTVHRSVPITAHFNVKAVDVRPQKVPDTIDWRVESDGSLSHELLTQLTNILTKAENRTINNDQSVHQLKKWLEKANLKTLVIKGVGALDGLDHDSLIFLKERLGHRKGSPPTGINVPLGAVKLGVFAKSRATCYFFYPSMLLFVGVSGYDGNAPRHGVTCFRWKGTDLQLAVCESDYTWVSEPQLLAHVYPLYGYSFKAELGAANTFTNASVGKWIGALGCNQIVLYPSPRGTPDVIPDSGDAKAQQASTMKVAYNALLEAANFQWRTSVHSEVATVLGCPICLETGGDVLFACKNGHQLCADCFSKLPTTTPQNTVHCPHCRDVALVNYPTAIRDLSAAICTKYHHIYRLTPQQAKSFKSMVTC